MLNMWYGSAIARIVFAVAALTASAACSDEPGVTADQPPGATEQQQPWYRHSLVGLEVGPTGAQFGHSDPQDAGYCARFDGAEIVRESVEGCAANIS